LLQVGILHHQAKSGRLIVRLSKEVSPGVVVLDDGGRKLGKVIELIGPIKSPYASIAVVSSKLGKRGDPVFVNR
jgi:RNA-binding protein